jgi:hypothetical protein
MYLIEALTIDDDIKKRAVQTSFGTPLKTDESSPGTIRQGTKMSVRITKYSHPDASRHPSAGDGTLRHWRPAILTERHSPQQTQVQELKK